MPTITVSRTSFPTGPAAGAGTYSWPQFVTLVVADVVQYQNPTTIVLGTSPTISPTVLTGTGNVAETGAGTNDLVEANLQVNATTGVVTAIDGSGATPVGDYSFELDRNGGDPFTWTVHVVLAGGDDDSGPIQSSAIQSSPIETSAIQASALG